MCIGVRVKGEALMYIFIRKKVLWMCVVPSVSWAQCPRIVQVSAAAQNSRGWWRWPNHGSIPGGLCGPGPSPYWPTSAGPYNGTSSTSLVRFLKHCEDIEGNLTEKSVPTRCIEIECGGVADDIWIMLNDPYLCSKLSVCWTKSITNYGLFMFPNCHQGGGLGWAGLGWADTGDISWPRWLGGTMGQGGDTGQGLVMITLTSISWPQFIVY